MICPECGERMTGSYDGGQENDYQLCVPSCRYCGYVDWDSASERADEETDEETH
jgi:hypothetical protein